jgi:hypothetical protein
MEKKMKKKIKPAKIRIDELANGPIKTQVKGTKKGKKGYLRKPKHKNSDND